MVLPRNRGYEITLVRGLTDNWNVRHRWFISLRGCMRTSIKLLTYRAAIAKFCDVTDRVDILGLERGLDRIIHVDLIDGGMESDCTVF